MALLVVFVLALSMFFAPSDSIAAGKLTVAAMENQPSPIYIEFFHTFAQEMGRWQKKNGDKYNGGWIVSLVEDNRLPPPHSVEVKAVVLMRRGQPVAVAKSMPVGYNPEAVIVIWAARDIGLPLPFPGIVVEVDAAATPRAIKAAAKKSAQEASKILVQQSRSAAKPRR